MLRIAFALTLLAPLGSAQIGPLVEVAVTGVVEKAPGASFCQQGETHQLDCTLVKLVSQSVDLTPFEGQNVRLLGVDIGVTCPVINVKQVLPPPTTLETCGTPAIGCPIRFVVCPGGIGASLLFVATTPGYLPLDLTTGTLLLGPDLSLLASAGPQGGCHDFDLVVPPIPPLVGKQFWFQAAYRTIGPVGPYQLTNSVCLTVLPPTVPCAQPGC